MKNKFRSEGKNYPMVIKTDYWIIGGADADDIGHKTYAEFFTYILRNLNLPHDYSILSIVPETLEEIASAHIEKGDYLERKEELESILNDAMNICLLYTSPSPRDS